MAEAAEAAVAVVRQEAALQERVAEPRPAERALTTQEWGRRQYHSVSSEGPEEAVVGAALWTSLAMDCQRVGLVALVGVAVSQQPGALVREAGRSSVIRSSVNRQQATLCCPHAPSVTAVAAGWKQKRPVRPARTAVEVAGVEQALHKS